MKFNQVLAMGVALSSGALALVMSMDYMSSLRTETDTEVKPAVAMTTVVATAKPLAHGRLIKREDLKVLKWPADSVPPGSYGTIASFLAGHKNRVALSHFGTNEVVTRNRVSGPGQRPSLSLILGKNMRAISVKVNAVLGVSGFVAAGDRVDLVLTEHQDEADPSKPRVSKVLLENVRVLATDQRTEDPEFKPAIASTVTLEVSLDDAQKVALASAMGSISLALRSAYNEQVAKVEKPEPVAVEIEQPPVRSRTRRIVIFRSAKPTEYDVPHVRATLWN